MAIVIRIRHTSGRTWATIVERAPKGWITPGDGKWILATSEEASTGVHLLDEGSDLVVRVPYFASHADIGTGARATTMFCKAVNGTLTIGENEIPLSVFEELLAMKYAPQLIEQSLAQLPRLQREPGAVFLVEGHRRTFYLGARTAKRMLESAKGDALYEAVIQAVCGLQNLGAETYFAKQVEVEKRGRRWTQATWPVDKETFLPPCQFLVVQAEGQPGITVPADQVANVVAESGVAIDDVQWLLLPVAKERVAALLTRARRAQRDPSQPRPQR